MERIMIWVEDYHGKAVLDAIDVLLTWVADDEENKDVVIINRDSFSDGDEYTMDVTPRGKNFLQNLQSVDLLYIRPNL